MHQFPAKKGDLGIYNHVRVFIERYLFLVHTHAYIDIRIITKQENMFHTNNAVPQKKQRIARFLRNQQIFLASSLFLVDSHHMLKHQNHNDLHTKVRYMQIIHMLLMISFSSKI